MIRFFLILTFALRASSIFAQKDAEKIDSLNFKSEELYSSDVSKSIEFSTLALELSEKIDYRPGKAFAFLNLAVANDIRGNSKVAIGYFQRAIRLFKLENDLENLSYCYSQIGVCYFSQYQYENADYYYRKAIPICRKLGLEIDLADVLVNQGITFTYQNKPEKAEENFKQAIKLYHKNAYPQGLGGAYNSLAKIYYDRKEFTTAITYFERSIANFEKYRNYFNLTSAYGGLANCYIDLKEFRKAEKYALKSLKVAQEIGATEREVFTHETLSRIYFALGDFKKAYESLNNYTVLSDSIFTREKSDALAEMQARFEVKEVKLKQKTQEENYKWQLVILVVIIFIVLLVSVLLFFLFRNKRRINLLLEQKYQITQASLEQKELMMGEVHHRVKNNLQMIYAILDLQSRELKDPESVRLIEDSLNRINAISMIHQNLYQSDNIRAVNIRSYLDELVQDLVRHFTNNHEHTIELHSDYEELNMDIETALPLGLIVAELVTNSCKYAFDKQIKPELYISLKEVGDRLVLSVSDNGTGKKSTASGTNFGTKLIQSMSRKLDATLVETNSGNGLKVELISSNYKIYHE
ncbi:tetratricopeptide repeat protein [Fluviicola sp.]|jgi:two-component sensor histidine kinase|uniref:tetratricopeptide repeat-containing sensor histidine kinase n=1 Tax=Fluviicola sp. TaxID=1917219 RepID=UPI002628FF6D|nr:tetratricopeptide repeat protein [Fluviicola sp.]